MLKSQTIEPTAKEIDLQPQVLSVVRLLTGIQADLAAASKDLWRERGLSERSLYILALVEMGLHRPSMLIDYFEVKPSTMTFELNKLVDTGLLERQIFPEDRRSISLRLTREGRRTHKTMTEMLNAFMLPRIASLDAGELETFLKIGYKLAQKDPPVRAQAPTPPTHKVAGAKP